MNELEKKQDLVKNIIVNLSKLMLESVREDTIKDINEIIIPLAEIQNIEEIKLMESYISEEVEKANKNDETIMQIELIRILTTAMFTNFKK